jgi:octaprenyl-diphosphate synthase
VSVVVDLEKRRRDEPSIDSLLALVNDDLERVNTVIHRNMQSPVATIPELAAHLIDAGGKRLRPMLTLAAARLCGYEGERHVNLAACVEFIHTATLLHDDVVDGSDMRRGRKAANIIFGNKSSVLVGDFLFSRAFELMVEDGSLDVLRILSNASSVIAEGEVMQLRTANNTETSETAYLEVIEAKTAKLFAAACEVGAAVAERPKVEREALVGFGHNIGIAFQLVDDILDYSAKQATLGKGVGDDFREGKVTLPVVLAFRRGDETERAFWRRTLEGLDQSEADLQHAIALMDRHDALADSLSRARHYGDMARDSLAIFPAGEIRDALVEVVDFCIRRAF